MTSQRNFANRNGKYRKQNAKGFTLVELMVALVLGFILIAGVLNIFNSNRENFRVTENLARIQENSRVAFDFMARNVREAGQTPCGAKLMANVLRSGGAIPWWADWNSGTIVGYDGSQDTTSIVGFGTSGGSRVAGTDAILIIKAAGNETNITLHNTATNEITLASTSGLLADDVVVACDLQTAALFQIGTLSASTKVLNYDSSFTTLNCANGLGYPTPLNCAATTLKLFSTNGGQLTKLDTTFWYIGYNSTGGKSLYKTRISRKTVAGVVQIFADKDEVAPNVQDMQITYLTKDLAADTLATTWSDASDAKFSAANGAWTETNNNQAVAARFILTFQSDEAVGTNAAPLQRQLIHIVSLRSRDTLFQSTP